MGYFGPTTAPAPLVFTPQNLIKCKYRLAVLVLIALVFTACEQVVDKPAPPPDTPPPRHAAARHGPKICGHRE